MRKGLTIHCGSWGLSCCLLSRAGGNRIRVPNFRKISSFDWLAGPFSSSVAPTNLPNFSSSEGGSCRDSICLAKACAGVFKKKGAAPGVSLGLKSCNSRSFSPMICHWMGMQGSKSNRPGDDMKEALRTDRNTAAWQTWSTTQNQLWQLR